MMTTAPQGAGGTELTRTSLVERVGVRVSHRLPVCLYTTALIDTFPRHRAVGEL